MNKTHKGKPTIKVKILEYLAGTVFKQMAVRKIANDTNSTYDETIACCKQLVEENKLEHFRNGRLSIYKLV